MYEPLLGDKNAQRLTNEGDIEIDTGWWEGM